MEKINGVVRFGQDSADVKLVQEWLTHHGFGVYPDGEFGKATRSAVEAFKQSRGLKGSEITPDEFEAYLAAPMATLEHMEARGVMGFAKLNPAEVMVELAHEHYTRKPTEIPNSNRGPWVRWYTGGQEVPWCAAFLNHIQKAAYKLKQVDRPYKGSLSCDILAQNAKAVGRLKRYEPAKCVPSPGDFMLFGDTSDFTHVGIIVAVDQAAGTTRNLEGNTAEKGKNKGSREGYMLGAMFRPLTMKYYIDNQTR